MSKVKLTKEKVHMLSWLIIPTLGIWIAISYLIGITHHPIWDRVETTTSQVLPASAVQLEPVPLHSKLNYQGGGLVTLWFDDAWSSQYLVALPIMKEKNLTGALAVPTKLLGFDAYMSWAQVKRIQAEGWEITSHTRSHNCDPKNLTPEQVENELLGAKQDLESQGLSADQFVTPCGADTPTILASAKEHYLSLRTSETGYNSIPVSDPYHLRVQIIHSKTTPFEVNQWIDQARTDHSWLILMFHQIEGNWTEYSTSPAIFNQILNEVKASGLPIVLPSQALQLVINQPST